MPEIDTEVRYSRQKDLVPLETLQDKTVTVIGVGAIGRQVAIQLAAMGVPKIQLIDFDTVETGNLAAQGFFEGDLGKPKVEAVAELLKSINSEVEIEVVNDRFRRRMNTGEIIFCCVDDMDIRDLIFTATQNTAVLFIDGRMSAEVLRVLSVFNLDSQNHYRTTLFSSEDAYRGSCTAKTTIYSSNVAAGIMTGTMAKWLRELPIDKDVQYNLLTNEISVE